MNLVTFLFTFVKIGTITYGGGLAMIPLLQDFATSNGWLSVRDFTDLIAISQSTPGPIAINLATFIGFKKFMFSGAILASVAVVLPGTILVILVSKFLQHFNEHPTVQLTLAGLKVSVIGLLGMAVYQVARVAFFDSTSGPIPWGHFDIKAGLLFIGIWIANQKTSFHPVVYLVCGGIVGVLMW
ncbi:MAG: chromate transporter [Clostridiales bacterium]|jgi:chromate transporter|nr:chromate transporter [Clostridiales bacterium]